MRRTAASVALRLVVTLVALCTVVGLTLMHSLGRHLDGHGHERTHGVLMLDPAGVGSMAGPGRLCDAGCVGVADPDGSGVGHAPWWQLCVAALGAALILLVRPRPEAVRPARVAGRWSGSRPVLRAPPRRPALGFVLATTSVLRT